MGVMAPDKERSDLCWEMVSYHRGWAKTRSRHLRALVMTKFWPVFHCGVLNVYLVILLIKYSINGDVSVPLWNWVAINGPVSHRPGLAERHLVLCPFLTDVQLDIDGFNDAIHRMRHIRLFFV